MAKIIGTKGQYDTDQGFYTKRENTTGEMQIVNKDGRIVDSVADENKAGNRTTAAWKVQHPFLRNVQEGTKDKTNPEVKEGVNKAGTSVMSAAETALKQKPVSDPQAGHTARQAALAQNQAAQVKAQQQQANQIAQKTSTTTGAMNEAQKVAEQSALQKQRLAAQQMAGDAGLANAAAAKAGAEVDPSQHFSEMQALGSQERQRAVQLGQEAANMAAGAEEVRARGTERMEQTQQAAEWNAQAKAANEANAALEQERYNKEMSLREKQINAEAAKNEAEASKAGAEGNKVSYENQQTEASSNEKKYADAQKIVAALTPKTALTEEQKLALYNGYIAGSSFQNGSGTKLLQTIASKIGRDGDFKNWFIETYKTNNKPDENTRKILQDINTVLSDKRMKTIETPVGHALMNIWKGRTI